MYLELTDEQQALRNEVRTYFQELLTPQVRADLAGGGGSGEAMRKVVRQMGTDRWLGVGWPVEYGGRGLTAAQHIHGGIGVDKDYPLHRFFLAFTQTELSLGGATEHLLRIGDELARVPA